MYMSYDMIEDTIWKINMCWKADVSKLNLPHKTKIYSPSSKFAEQAKKTGEKLQNKWEKLIMEKV